ncbi:MAG: ATP-binding cassette domain-containing protein, partial [Prolixibacteraceae bacterium]|nr:ATP-binding cassette domain-containing protein [Prolixibacteraceae bacterium]
MIIWDNVDIKIRTTFILKEISLKIEKGNSLGIIGANGSGKTILAKALSGILPVSGNVKTICPEKIHYLSFQSAFRLKSGFSPYRQQRWNNIDTDSVPTVAEEIGFQNNPKILETLLEKFSFRKFLSLPVISLSNGEQRKMELIRALAKQPELLVIDNAFIGLDQSSRQLLHTMLNQLIEEEQAMVITGVKPEDFPVALDSFIELPDFEGKKQSAFEIPEWPEYSVNEIISVENLSLKMNGQNILENISWKVQKGEKWVLSGGNGSGKTSLLNMIFA